ncbi:MAG: hypothetical protein ING19_19680 [Azospirillum sp.]|nr:hypothetical protein [Azospirillum sp.]MCA3268288.1 hypothetical protein [Azospirillum sp.]MCZ8124721.1 hypothetical protein [Magnetospirillum sp.]
MRSILLIAAFLVAGCAGGLPPGGVAALDGVYEGEVIRSGGHAMRCPAAYKLRISVAGGEARGEIFDIQQPDAPLDRFMAFIEADGRVITAIRVGSQTFGIQGRFGTSTFRGMADSPACGMSAFAARKP